MGKKSTVSTPLILLQQLSRSLLRHFDDACEQALGATQQLLEKLEKQRGKIEYRLRRAELACTEAAAAGKSKAQARARAELDRLQAALDDVLDRQLQTHAYLAHLQRDVKSSRELAQGIARVAEDAGKTLDAVTASGSRPASAKAVPRRIAKPQTQASPAKVAVAPSTPRSKRGAAVRDSAKAD